MFPIPNRLQLKTADGALNIEYIQENKWRLWPPWTRMYSWNACINSQSLQASNHTCLSVWYSLCRVWAESVWNVWQSLWQSLEFVAELILCMLIFLNSCHSVKALRIGKRKTGRAALSQRPPGEQENAQAYTVANTGWPNPTSLINPMF